MDVIKALSFVYVVLSILDAAITASIIKHFSEDGFLHEVESNPVASIVIKNFGIGGMLVFKTAMVVMAIAMVFFIHKNDHKRHSLFRRFVKPHYVIWLGIWTTLIAVVCGILYFFLYNGV